MKKLSKIFAGTLFCIASLTTLLAGTLPGSLKPEPHQRDTYGWANRHAAVLFRNKTVKPAYVFFGVYLPLYT